MNPEQYKAHKKAINQRYLKKHPDRRKATVRRHYLSHKSYKNTQSKVWAKTNPERTKQIQKDYRERNIDEIRFKSKLAKYKRRNAEGSFTKQEWSSLVEYTLGICIGCEELVGEENLTVDHIIPISRGGTNYISNLQPLCMKCNFEKGTNIVNLLENPNVALSDD